MDDKQYILHPFSIYNPNEANIHIVRGAGTKVWDKDGNAYIDAVGSWWVNLHGHSHPAINQAAIDQIQSLEHIMFSGFTHSPAIDLAKNIIHTLPDSFVQLFYSDNGSTATEVALKMTLQYWNNIGQPKSTFIAFNNSYHGDTFGAMAVSERDIFTAPFHQHLFDVQFIDLPQSDNIEQIKNTLLAIIDNHAVAGFIFEPLVQGAGGMRMYEAALLDEIIQLCHQNNIITIADEVMTGFGRTGKIMAIEHLRHTPDFICLSKGLTGGYLPLGITAFNQKIAAVYQNSAPDKTFYHGHSFTANPIACAVANKSLELLQSEECTQQRQAIEAQHRTFAQKTQSHPLAENVRVQGVILALDIKTKHTAYFYNNPIKHFVYQFFLKKGIIMRPLGNVIYIIPPYCITQEELSSVYQAITDCLDAIQVLQ